MDKKIFRSVSYGMYFVTSSVDDKRAGCVINTFCQINSVDPLVSISLNHDNYTSEVIKKRGKFSVSIISNDTTKEIIGKFGYQSSKDVDKFDGTDYKIVDGLPVVMDNVVGYVTVEVVNVIDCNTHDIIVGRVVETCVVSDKVPMTYKYYHENLKGVSPKNAPTYVSDEKEVEVMEGNKYRCTICGYIYDDSKEEVKFDELPDDWCCPLCGAPKNLFEKI